MNNTHLSLNRGLESSALNGLYFTTLFSVHNLNMSWPLSGNVYWLCLKVHCVLISVNSQGKETITPQPKNHAGMTTTVLMAQSSIFLEPHYTPSDKQSKGRHVCLESMKTEVIWLAQVHKVRERQLGLEWRSFNNWKNLFTPKFEALLSESANSLIQDFWVC